MKLIKVEDKSTSKKFLDVAREIYKNDKNWICPLDNMVDAVFNPAENEFFHQGDAVRWILVDEENKSIGRIAAFYNKTKAEKYDPPTGGIGFFECINNQESAFQLFDAAKLWLQEKGMGAMDGPINFGENDNFWGLLVEGFTPPAFGMNYNPPYYKELFEAYGFNAFFEQETKHLDVRKPFPDRFWKIAEWVLRKPEYTYEYFQLKDIEKYAGDFVEIHNAAWVFHEHFTPLKVEKILKSLNDAKPFIIEDFIWFVYHEGKPIAVLVMLPDVNKIFNRFNGKMTLWNKLRFLYLKRTKTITRSRITVLGVVPKFQGKGIESALFWHLKEPLLNKRPHYDEIEISWVGDYNPKMKATLDAMGANPGKTHITYRKLFDDSQEFKKANTIS